MKAKVRFGIFFLAPAFEKQQVWPLPAPPPPARPPAATLGGPGAVTLRLGMVLLKVSGDLSFLYKPRSVFAAGMKLTCA